MSKKLKDKTLAMRVLEGRDIPYEVVRFPATIHDAVELAQHVGLPPDNVYKTLVVEANEPGFKPMLVMIAANTKLDMKKTAKSIGAKRVHMARHVDAEKMTKLQTGGISALALLNKGFKIYIDEWAMVLDYIVVSAGKRGLNLRLDVDALIEVTNAEMISVSVD